MLSVIPVPRLTLVAGHAPAQTAGVGDRDLVTAAAVGRGFFQQGEVGALKLLTPSPVNLPFALERVGDFARTVRRGESEVRCADDGAVCRECRGTYPSTGLMTTRLVPRRTARPRERVCAGSNGRPVAGSDGRIEGQRASRAGCTAAHL